MDRSRDQDTVDWDNLRAPAEAETPGRRRLFSFITWPPRRHSSPRDPERGQSLPPPDRDRFRRVYSGHGCKLEMRKNPLGDEVRLTINAQTSLRTMLRELITEESWRHPHTSAGLMEVLGYIDEDRPPGVPDFANFERVVTFIPVINNSSCRSRFGTDPAKAHLAMLRAKELTWIERPLLAIAAMAWRLARGEGLEGDLLKGLTVRTRKGALCWYSPLGLCPVEDYSSDADKYLAVGGRKFDQYWGTNDRFSGIDRESDLGDCEE